MLFMSEHFAWIDTANRTAFVPPLTNHIASKLLRNGGAFYLNGDLDIIGGPLFISFISFLWWPKITSPFQSRGISYIRKSELVNLRNKSNAHT